MSDLAIRLAGVGKMYRMYDRPVDKVVDALGINSLLFWRRDYYKPFWALQDLDLDIPRGQRLGIIGRNGAGKSTLLKIICGSVGATHGEVEVRGRIQALLELGTGFHPEFTGRQNIRACLAYQGLPPNEVREKIDEIAAFAELGSFIDQPVKTYSAGMYARLAFSASTAINPKILIIDEVLGAGDAYFAGKCLERMRQLTEESGATVIFVSHDLASIQQLCQRVIWIDKGRMRMDDTPLSVTKAYYASIMAQEEERLRQRNRELVMKHGGIDGTRISASEEEAKTGDSASDRPEARQDAWQTEFATFLDIQPITRDGKVRHAFPSCEDFGFCISAEIKCELRTCWLAVVIYDAKGNRAVFHLHNFPDPIQAGRITWKWWVLHPVLRQGEYVCSFELLPYYDANATEKLPFYCHWNRRLVFRIDEGYTGHVELGLVKLTFDLRTAEPEPGKGVALADRASESSP